VASPDTKATSSGADRRCQRTENQVAHLEIAGQLRITGVAGDSRDIARQTIDTFAASLEGSLIYPDDEGFADAILIWNGMITKRPAVVVRPHTTQDVVKTVDLVRDNGFQLSIKGGGHNIAGLALSDGGITLDMSGMREVKVDVEAQVARVGPGCTLGDVDQATQQHGLASTLGFVSATGVAGLTLGGGFGYLTRRFGWTVDDLEEVEIVTADRGSLLGAPRRRRQLRSRHRVRPKAPRGRPTGDGWPDRLAGIPSGRRPGALPQDRRVCVARVDRDRTEAQRTAGSLVARSSAWHTDHRHGGLPLWEP
jgi:FAD/FMN-containing dehydrogenase